VTTVFWRLMMTEMNLLLFVYRHQVRALKYVINLVDVKVNLVNKKMYYGCSINILLGLQEKLSST